MQTISPVSADLRLWQVQDLLPSVQAEEICQADWTNAERVQSAGQEAWLRDQIHWSNPLAQRFSTYINQQLPSINLALGTEYTRGTGNFWIDRPGFTVPLHTDGHLPMAMQLYWVMPSLDYGTGFYRYRNLDHLVYQFASQSNSGYIMLNHANTDGSQPLLWHAMLNPVPNGHVRISSYWRFE